MKIDMQNVFAWVQKKTSAVHDVCVEWVEKVKNVFKKSLVALQIQCDLAGQFWFKTPFFQCACRQEKDGVWVIPDFKFKDLFPKFHSYQYLKNTPHAYTHTENHMCTFLKTVYWHKLGIGTKNGMKKKNKFTKKSIDSD